MFHFFKKTWCKKLVETIKKSNEVKRKLQIKNFCSSVESVDSNSSISPELPVTCCQNHQISIGLREEIYINCWLGTDLGNSYIDWRCHLLWARHQWRHNWVPEGQKTHTDTYKKCARLPQQWSLSVELQQILVLRTQPLQINPREHQETKKDWKPDCKCIAEKAFQWLWETTVSSGKKDKAQQELKVHWAGTVLAKDGC